MEEYLSKTMFRIKAGALRLAAKALRYSEGLVEIEATETGLAYSTKGIKGMIPWKRVWRLDPELVGKVWKVDARKLVMAGGLIPSEVIACEQLLDNRNNRDDKCYEAMAGKELEETLAWSKIPRVYVMLRETGIEFQWLDVSDITILVFSVGEHGSEEPGKKS